MKLNSKKYPDYKNTDIEWMGEVPKHWEIDRLKWATELPVNGTWGSEANNDEHDTLCIRVADFDRQRLIVDRQNEKTYREIEEKDLKNRSLETGDLLLEKSGGGEKQLVGAVIQYDLDERAVCSNFVARMRPRENFDSRFLTYLYDHLYSGKVNYCSIKQTTGIQNLDSQAYLDEKVAYPPLPEQKAIATFLDQQTTRIDQLIEKKKRILDLLDEQRQAIITRAVTKGIDSNAKMKDSGIEWLGEVPEHWEFKPIKYLVDIDSEKLKESEDPDLELEYIDIGSVDSEGNINNRESMRFEKAPSRARRIVKKGDTILATVRTYLKAIAQIDYDFNTLQICSTGFAVLRPKEVFPRFLFYWVRSDYFIGEIVSRSVGVSYPAISSSEIGKLPIPDLAVNEQKQIASLIDKEIVRIDRIKEKIKTAINHLEEYRSSLITQAVTGKIDVRNEVSEQELSYAAEEGESYTTN
ncbi:restriction endonuclease subunit S [Gracilimonas amylolytica]|uniref:restriction endonuclease subunit S n=1 Tax=Gracilimonas amylolytica TaxID=1749045 RepID=UPI000CD93410|nr:restriction endonuclease subunit S [Gracilimonas amylolytica]